MEEEILKRWQGNVMKGCLKLTEEERKQFDDFIASTGNLPFTCSEYKFRLNCQSLLKYAKRHDEDPTTPKNVTELIKWYSKTSSDYAQLKGRKKTYFDELLAELKEFEFYIPE